MRSKLEPGRENRALKLVCLLGVSLLCLSVFAGYAAAQAEPPEKKADGGAEATPPAGTEEKPEATPAAEATQSSDAPPSVEPPPSSKGQLKVGAGRRRGVGPGVGPSATRSKSANAEERKKPGKSRKFDGSKRKPTSRKRKPTFEMDENAKWACAETVSSLPSVWRGDKKLTFDFYIRSEGAAALKIKGKGG